MIRLVRAELLKVRTTRLWLGLLIGAVALDAVGVIATLALAGTAEGARANIRPITTVEDVQSLVWGGAVFWLFTAVLTATMSTGEYRYGTAAGTYLGDAVARPRARLEDGGRDPDRVRWPASSAAGCPSSSRLAWFAVKGDALPFGVPVLTAVLEVGLQCTYAA